MSETSISLFDSFASVPDPRSALGKRHPLTAILTLCSVAMLCGCRSLYAIAQFGRDRGKHFAAALGFTRDVPPCCTTLHNLFLVLDKIAFEQAIAQWSHAAATAHGWTTVSLDGKTLRGSTDVQLPGVHLLAAYAHEAGIVLRQLPVDAKTNEHKAALEMLDLIAVKGKLIIGDAMFCQRDLSRKIRAKQGDYLWPVKDNQPDLLAAIEDAFDDADTSPRQQALAAAERQTARTVNKGHGRLETRTLLSTTQLDEGYLDFPGVAQCFRLTRTRALRDRATGQINTTSETVFGITSLPRERADAAELLKLVRAHWGIENKVFHVRDQTMGEDACRVRKRSAPIIFATLRNSVLNVLQRLGVKNRAAQFRTFCADPVKALHAIQRK